MIIACFNDCFSTDVTVGRRAEIATMRFGCMAWMVEDGYTLTSIGRTFGKGHPTVSYAYCRFSELIKMNDKQAMEVWQRLLLYMGEPKNVANGGKPFKLFGLKYLQNRDLGK